MTATIRVHIVSQEASVYSGVAQMVIASGILGDLGIAPHHAPLLTVLKPGPVRIIQSDTEEEIIYVSGGILEVQPTQIIILADVVVRGADLDEAAVENARKLAEEKLSGRHGEIDYSMARAELARAVGLLRTLREIRAHLK